MTSFMEKFRSARSTNNSLLCLGLDPDRDRIPEIFEQMEVEKWCKNIIESAVHVASVVKPNVAFFSANRLENELERVIAYAQYCDLPVILDAKRGDIGNTARQYAREAFERYGADAVTLNPYLGFEDCMEPYLEYDGRGLIILCHTSNKGSGEFQELMVDPTTGRLVYERVAEVAAKWDEKAGGGRIGLVLGATYPAELANIRRIVGPDVFILAPGVGKQAGDVEATVKAGGENMAINVSSGINYAKNPFAAAQEFRDQFNLYR
ncbi:orotidine-5'-phosphate decarboxylase [Candidatus Gracilibacteria bacterium]|nr:orotidine-5'-phosphate decarboxylase [Candidatus Gracilibacteria bacterium]